MRMSSWRVIALVVTTLAQAGSAESTHRVSPGDDLQARMNNALSGDVFLLGDGTYMQPSDPGIEITKSVTIRAQNPGLAILSGESKRVVVRVNAAQFRPYSHTVIFDGLRITAGTNRRSAGRMGHGPGGVLIECCSAVTFRNCRLDNNQGEKGGAIGKRAESGLTFQHDALVIEDSVIEQNEAAQVRQAPLLAHFSCPPAA